MQGYERSRFRLNPNALLIAGRLGHRVWHATGRERDQAGRQYPRVNLDAKPARLHRRILLLEFERGLRVDPQEGDTAQFAIGSSEYGTGCQQEARLVQFGEVVEVRVL